MSLFRPCVGLILTGCLAVALARSARTQDVDSIVRFAPVDSVSAVWTDEVSITLEPVAKRLATWLDLYEQELSAAKLDGDDDLREPIERHQRLLDELRRIQQGLEAPVLDGPLIVYESPSGSKVIVARVGSDREALTEFLSAIETLAVELAGPLWKDAIASEERWRLVDGWWLWSDSSETLEALEARVMAETTIESLEESREFQTVRAHVPRGLPGSWRFHLSQAAIKPTLMALWQGADQLQVIIDQDTREYVWTGCGMDDLRALGGQWTFQHDDRWSDSPPIASLEAFAVQGIPFRGLAASLEHGEGFQLDRVTTRAPQFSLYTQFLINGPKFEREVTTGARRVATPLAVVMGKSVDELLDEAWEHVSLGWSPELSKQFNSLSIGTPFDWRDSGTDRFYTHVALRFRNAASLREAFKRLVLKIIVADEQRELSIDQLDVSQIDEMADEYGPYLRTSERYIESRRRNWLKDVETTYSGENLQRLIGFYIDKVHQETGETPTQAEIDRVFRERKIAALKLALEQFNDMLPGFNLMFPLDHDWIIVPPLSASFQVTDAPRAHEQLVDLQHEMDWFAGASQMQSQPVVVIATWNENTHQLTDLTKRVGDRESEELDLELAQEEPRVPSRLHSGVLHEIQLLSRGKVTENPVQWICNNSLILIGLKEKGWEIRAAIGVRPPTSLEHSSPGSADEEDR